jgi:hypothetical protein
MHCCSFGHWVAGFQTNDLTFHEFVIENIDENHYFELFVRFASMLA